MNEHGENAPRDDAIYKKVGGALIRQSPDNPNQLTDVHLAFVDAVVAGMNFADAAKHAGVKTVAFAKRGSQIAKNPKVERELERRGWIGRAARAALEAPARRDMALSATISPARVCEILAAILEAEPLALLKTNKYGKVVPLPLREIPQAIRPAIKKFVLKDGQLTVELYDKIQAADRLARIMGIYRDTAAPPKEPSAPDDEQPPLKPGEVVTRRTWEETVRSRHASGTHVAEPQIIDG